MFRAFDPMPRDEIQLANKFGVKTPSVNRRPNGKGYYNNNALNANVLNESEKVQGIKITRKPWVPQQKHYVKEGQDVAEMLGLETFIAPNGKFIDLKGFNHNTTNSLLGNHKSNSKLTLLKKSVRIIVPL